MKTSKIILTSYLGVIGLFLLSFLIQVPERNRNNNILINLQKENIELPRITRIVVSDGYFDLNTGNNDSLKIGLNKAKLPALPIFRISNDTLFITGNKNANTFFMEVSCKSVQEIILDHSNCDINDTLINRLKLKGNTSNIYLSDNKIFSFLSVDLTDNSNVYGNSVKIDTLQIFSKSSKCDLYDHSAIKHLFGELRDSSQLTAKRVYETNLKADSLSKFNIW